MPPKQKYTDPKLRDEVKEDIKNSDKGGAPGQWSARKAQFMASEYKKRGGDYNQDKSEQDDSQQNLSKWTEEEWQTKEGSGSAKKSDGTQKRYLPKKAWEQMSEGEKEKTENKKQKGSKQGKQFVGNTEKAKGARKNAEADADGEDEQNGEEEGEDDEEDAEEEQQKSEEEKPKRGSKRKSEQTNGTTSTSSNKKQKSEANSKDSKPQANSSKKQSAPSTKKKGQTMGSRHDPANPPAQQASTSRLPKKGKQVTWKAMPGWVKGTVLEIAKKDGETEGKKYKASKEDPTIVLRAESGKVCAHKAKSVYFD